MNNLQTINFHGTEIPVFEKRRQAVRCDETHR